MINELIGHPDIPKNTSDGRRQNPSPPQTYARKVPLQEPSSELENRDKRMATSNDIRKLLADGHVLRVAQESLKRFAGGQNIQAIREALQDACIKAIQHADQFEIGTNFNAWFHRIAVHAFIDHYRKDERQITRKAREFFEEDPEMERYSGYDPDKEEKASMANRLREVIESMLADGEINEQEARLFIAHTIEEKTHQEIADELKIAYGTSLSRSFRIREKIKAYMKKYFPELVRGDLA